METLSVEYLQIQCRDLFLSAQSKLQLLLILPDRIIKDINTIGSTIIFKIQCRLFNIENGLTSIQLDRQHNCLLRNIEFHKVPLLQSVDTYMLFK